MSASSGASLDERVLEVLRAGGPMTAAQIGAALGLDRLPVRRALVRLRNRGLVRLAGMDHSSPALAAGGLPGLWEAAPAD